MYESGEHYLETIFLLQKRKGMVKSIDIARELKFSKPSVSRAIRLLRDADYIDIAEGGFIHLKEKGLEKAEKIYERHQLITLFLTNTLDISSEIAEQDACKIEHIISEELFISIKNYFQNAPSLTNSQDKQLKRPL